MGKKEIVREALDWDQGIVSTFLTLFTDPKKVVTNPDKFTRPWKYATYVASIRGDIDLGTQWLLLNVDMKHSNDGTLVASIYLMLAYHLKNDLTNRDKHRKFVKENESKLEKDSLLLWERCLKKIEPNLVAS